jgi:hypothetical protein
MKRRERDTDATDLESPLGLADEPITQSSSDHIVNTGDASSRRRRARALGEDGIERQSSGLGDVLGDEHDGATSIDMGYGGDGTNIKSSR